MVGLEQLDLDSPKLVLGNRSYLPMAGPVVLGMDQPNWELVDCKVVLVVVRLGSPMVELGLLGWDLPRLGPELVEHTLAAGNYLLELDSC